MRLVREILYEKFTEDSDPIEDLGIGIKFSRIKVGDIINAKQTLYMVKDQKHNEFSSQYKLKFGKCTNYRFKLRNNYYSIVTTVNKKSNLLYLEAIPFGDISSCKTFWNDTLKYIKGSQTKIKTDRWKGSYDWYFREAPLLIWEKYFTVIE